MTPAELLAFEGHPHTIFDLLSSRDLIARELLQAPFDGDEAAGKPLVSLLLDSDFITKPVRLRAVAGHLGDDYADKLPEGIPTNMIQLVSGENARSYGVLPVTVDDLALTLLVVDPFSPHLLNDLAVALARDVRLAVADPESVNALILEYCGSGENLANETPIKLPAFLEEPLAPAEIARWRLLHRL